jgi:predicted nuclease with TOPRIM domain
VAEDLLRVLTRFHREVVAPEIKQIAEQGHRTEAGLQVFRNETLSGFDAMYKKLDRLDSEYVALKAAVQRLEAGMARVEERLAAVDEKLDKVALRAELVELREMAVAIQHRISELEASLQ